MTGREMAAMSGQESIVVIRRPFVQWLGNISRALLFDQLLFEGDKHGGEWFAVTDDEWANRLLLSRREIRDGRDWLTGLGILESEPRGMPRRTWYKLDADKAAKLFTAALETQGGSTLEWPNGRARLAKRPRKSGQMGGHSIVEGGIEGIEGTTLAPNDGAGDDALPEGPTAVDVKPRKARAPRQPKPADPLAIVVSEIASDLTGRGEVQSKDRKLLYPLISDIRKMVGTSAAGGLSLWYAFKEAKETDHGWQFVEAHNARNKFGRWAANGGRPTVEGILAAIDTPVTAGGAS